MSGPHTLHWTDPSTYNDTAQTPLDPSKIVGYEVSIDAVPAVSIPKQSGNTFDLTQLAVFSTLAPGSHIANLAVVLDAADGGAVGDFGHATFPAFGTPAAPTNLTVS